MTTRKPYVTQRTKEFKDVSYPNSRSYNWNFNRLRKSNRKNIWVGIFFAWICIWKWKTFFQRLLESLSSIGFTKETSNVKKFYWNFVRVQYIERERIWEHVNISKKTIILQKLNDQNEKQSVYCFILIEGTEARWPQKSLYSFKLQEQEMVEI